MAVLHAYLDESGTHGDSAITCSAGYLFSQEGSVAFGNLWKPYLRSKGIECFHAKEDVTRSDAGEIFSKLRATTKETAEKGFVRFILSDALKSLSQEHAFKQFTGSGYSLLTLSCMRKMAEYAASKGDEIWYFIESGDANQSEFEEILRTVKADTNLRREYALYESSFIPKKDGAQLQSADLAAWSFGRAWNEKWIPGFSGFGDWKDWYHPNHSMAGVTEQGCKIQGMVNAVNGIRVIP